MFLPEIAHCMTACKRYFDDTITYAKPDSVDYALLFLNLFYSNIKYM